MQALADYENSKELSEREITVLRYSDAMTRTPVDVSDELFAEICRHYDDSQIVELTSAIAWENYRARFDHALILKRKAFRRELIVLYLLRQPNGQTSSQISIWEHKWNSVSCV